MELKDILAKCDHTLLLRPPHGRRSKPSATMV